MAQGKVRQKNYVMGKNHKGLRSARRGRRNAGGRKKYGIVTKQIVDKLGGGWGKKKKEKVPVQRVGSSKKR